MRHKRAERVCGEQVLDSRRKQGRWQLGWEKNPPCRAQRHPPRTSFFAASRDAVTIASVSMRSSSGIMRWPGGQASRISRSLRAALSSTAHCALRASRYSGTLP